MTILQAVLVDQGIERKGFTERCERSLHTLRSGVRDSMTHPGCSYYSEGEAGLEPRSLDRGQPGAAWRWKEWGHCSWESGLKFPGCQDYWARSHSPVSGPSPSPIPPPFPNANVSAGHSAWQRGLGERSGIAALVWLGLGHRGKGAKTNWG